MIYKIIISVNYVKIYQRFHATSMCWSFRDLKLWCSFGKGFKSLKWYLKNIGLYIRSIKHLYFEYISFITHLTWIWYCTVVYRINVFRRKQCTFHERCECKYWFCCFYLMPYNFSGEFDCLHFGRKIWCVVCWQRKNICCTKQRNH